jgi:hypothetical protein
VSSAAPTGQASGRDLNRDLTRTVIAATFAEALDLDHVDPGENFFHLDGDSLSAIRVLAEIRSRLGREVGIGDFFADPTVDALVEHVVAGPGDADGPALGDVPRGEHPSLSLTQEGLWFQAQLEGRTSSSFNLPVVLNLAAEPDTRALAAALTDLVARHESLRTVHPEKDGLPYQHVLDPDGAVALDVDDSAEVDALAACGFDVTVDPPLRATLTGAAGARKLVLVLHHLACDGASLPVLLGDLDHAYAARRDGTSPVWSTTPVQYADFSSWQRTRLVNGDRPTSLATRQKEFWASELAGLPTESPLTTDRPRRPDRVPTSAVVEQPLSEAATGRLVEVCRRTATTTFMVVQAAYAAAIGAASGSDTIVVGVPVSTRVDPALAGSVGMFVTMLPLRTEVLGDRPAGEVLDAVRARDLSAFENADLPFAHIVAAVNPPRSSGMHPLFQHALTVQAPTGALSTLPHLAATPSYGELQTAKHDLTLAVVAANDPAGTPAAPLLRLEYATDLFDESTAAGLLRSTLGHLEAILTDVLGSQEETS